jgi:hypothetical protein
MTGRRRRFMATVTLVLGLVASSVGSVQAADDFTLPFPNPSIALSYGMDRDLRVGYQLDWTGQLWRDSAPHLGRVYDQHTGLDYPMALQSPVLAARSGTVVDIEEGIGTTTYGPYGNFVRVRHSDGRDTLYYHLAQSGALVGVGQAVVAGQAIGKSGCSGLCYGAHLHFELLKPYGTGWQPVDPMAERRWTTWPGRVPFLAAYRTESYGGTVAIKRLTTVSHWVEFRNAGGRTWSRDTASTRLVLATWNPAARTSAFRAADWPSAWIPTYLDQASVPPDGIGRFTFGLRAPGTIGSYTEAFNLMAHPIAWFDWTRLGGYYLPIVVYSGEVP